MPEVDDGAAGHEHTSHHSADLAQELAGLAAGTEVDEPDDTELDLPRGALDGIRHPKPAGRAEASAPEVPAGAVEVADTPAVPPETTAMVAARVEVTEVLDRHEVQQLLEGLEFPPEASKFSLNNNNGHFTPGQNAPGLHEGTLYGPGRYTYAPHYPKDTKGGNAWVSSREEAGASGLPVEQAGVRKHEVINFEPTTRKERRSGLAGAIGLNKAVPDIEAVRTGEDAHFFDYQFAAPQETRAQTEAAKAVGNYTGQEISLSVQISEEQAKALSKLLEADPTVARQVVDEYMRKTGKDMGKWNAELFDDEGNFQNPVEHHPEDAFLAREVRPHYEVMPDLEPQIVGLIEAKA